MTATADIIRLLSAGPTQEESYAAGYDCGYVKATTQNCHFAFFRTPEHTREWERGKRAGQRDKRKGRAA